MTVATVSEYAVGYQVLKETAAKPPTIQQQGGGVTAVPGAVEDAVVCSPEDELVNAEVCRGHI